MFHKEVGQRNLYPLGDERWQGQLIKVRERVSRPELPEDFLQLTSNS